MVLLTTEQRKGFRKLNKDMKSLEFKIEEAFAQRKFKDVEKFVGLYNFLDDYCKCVYGEDYKIKNKDEI